MILNPSTQAVLLLTVVFDKRNSATKPLTPTEYGRFAEWLKNSGLSPDNLLTGNPLELLSEFDDDKIDHERILRLLDRGSALALSIDKWARAGVWVVDRSDPFYPTRLKKHLRGNSPALLFGCGNRSLLDKGGLAVVGSRAVSSKDLSYASDLGKKTSCEGFSVISGAAKGVDETAMLGALESDGTAVGVMSDSLLRSSSSAKYRNHLLSNNLVLVTPFNPEAGFNVGNAMARNKYIYCLSDAAFVVHSGKTGGTWSGANENLKKRWVPLSVKINSDMNSGNADLIALGSKQSPLNIEDLNIKTLFDFENNALDGSNLQEKVGTSVGKQKVETEVVSEIPIPKQDSFDF